MTRVLGLLGCLAVLVVFAFGRGPAVAADAPAMPPPPPKQSTHDSLEVQKQVDAGNGNFIKAWKTGDADLFASCFATDGALFRGGGQVVLGRDVIRERMKGNFGRLRMTDGVIKTTGLWLIGDYAYETGKWVFTIGPVAELATAQLDSGYFVEIWRLEDGKWRMWRDIGVPRE